ncbi:MAG: FecR domain-containing protein [Deltaproteobacteria bacterium]|nr:FecR domain-containing protein [Deltaproteobacteria bacterium]
MFLLSLWGLGASCSRCQEEVARQPDAATDVAKAKPFAELFELQGLVEWRQGESGVWKNAANGLVIAIEDTIRTGDKSRAGIRFADGRSLMLEANSELSLANVAGGFALLLGSGEMEVTAGGDSAGFRLIFGDSSEFMILGDGQARLTRGENGVRIQMIMGKATIGEGENARTLSSGESFQLTFGQAEILDAKELETRLVDRRRRSRVKAPDAKRFSRPAKRNTVLLPSSEIKVGNKAVILADELGGVLELSKRSRVVYLGARQSPKGREGKIRIQAGRARIQLVRGQLKASSQEASTPHAEVRARVRGLTADTQVNTNRKGTTIQVHAGAADVQVGDKRFELLAGQMMVVGKRGKTTGPRSMGKAMVWAREGLRTRIFYDRRMSRVGFSFKQVPEGQDARLEIATNRGFEKPLISEPVKGKRFVYARIKPRKYFWRMVRDGKAGRAGLLELGKDPALGMKRSGALTNIVRDTGIQTKIYFQGSVPALTFRWEKIENAAKYLVRIFGEDDLEKALVSKEATGNRFKLKAGKLGEGTYYWYQTARDASGKELHSSQMNKLLLSFQNAAPLLRIDKAGAGRVRGMAALGSTLHVNGKLVPLGKDGRFDAKVKLVKGKPAIFRLRKRGGGDIYFIRRAK